MSETFLTNFLQAAQAITKAERGMAVDSNLEILATLNLSDAELDESSFSECAEKTLNQALDSNEAIITNNLIVDPANAPDTNTNLANLRFVVAIPLSDIGAIYLDQRIKTGILISQEIVQNLMRLAKHIRERKLEASTPDEMVSMYQQIM